MASSDSEGSNTNEVPRKRGRSSKKPQKDDDQEEEVKQEADDAPVVKKSPGRPKGSKNKTQKEKPEDTGPKRPRGRPRKWPPVEKPTGPKRKRGRPKKNPVTEAKAADES